MGLRGLKCEYPRSGKEATRVGWALLQCAEPLPPASSPTDAVPTLPYPVRTECPPSLCNCGLAALVAAAEDGSAPEAALRILRLSRKEELRLLERLEQLSSLEDLRRMEARMAEQLGLRLSITPSTNEVRTLRGITILVHEQPGLCRKTRQAIPAAIKKSMDARPEIAWALLDEGGLFGGA